MNLDILTQAPTSDRCVAVLYPADSDADRFGSVVEALKAVGLCTEAVPYRDERHDEVRRQLLRVDGVLVWVNPIQAGRDRSVLDALLREVAAAGVFVSAHPDVILKIGTKQVLVDTRGLGWGCDTNVLRSVDELRQQLPALLARGPRVLKQFRGQSGDGVWKVERAEAGLLRVRHAKRGSREELVPLEAFVERCAAYFAGDGRLIDQEWQPRIAEGMVRCYLVRDTVAGFGHQAINSLHPEVDDPGPRLYYPPTRADFQVLRACVERDWVPGMCRLLELEVDQLPLLWDCDFMLGPKDADGRDRYVLCEINASSVHPFPESALEPLARAVRERVMRRPS